MHTQIFLEKFDTDKSGTLDREELGQGLRAMGIAPSDKRLTELFARIDLDSSGAVDYDVCMCVCMNECVCMHVCMWCVCVCVCMSRETERKICSFMY